MSISSYFYEGNHIIQYHLLEEDFIKFIEYIPLELYIDKRDKIVSPKLGDLLLRIGSNIDIFFRKYIESKKEKCKKLINDLPKDLKKLNWGHYKKIEPIIKIEDKKLNIIQTREEIYPFKNWTNISENKDFWWKSYNKYKHNGDVYKANLDNVLLALGAYCILINKMAVPSQMAMYDYMPINSEFKIEILTDKLPVTKINFVSKVFILMRGKYKNKK